MTIIGHTNKGTPIGGWLLKCNPEVWNPAYALADDPVERNWSVSESYRLELMRPGDPCVLWVTGSRSSPVPAGVYAYGTLTAGTDGNVVYLDRWSDTVNPPEGEDAQDVRPFVNCELRWLAKPVLRDELRDAPTFANAEILRIAQVSNPSVLTPDEMAVIQSHDLTPGPVTDEQLDAFGAIYQPEADEVSLVDLCGPDGQPAFMLFETDAGFELVKAIPDQTFETDALVETWDGAVDALVRAAESLEFAAYPSQPVDKEDPLPTVAVDGEDGMYLLIRRGESEWVEYILSYEGEDDDGEVETYLSVGDYLETLRDAGVSGDE